MQSLPAHSLSKVEVVDGLGCYSDLTLNAMLCMLTL